MRLSLQNNALGSPIAPEPVSFAFDGPGWYFLGVLLLLFALAMVIYKWVNYRKNAFRREAIRQIEDVHTNLNQQLALCYVLLKKVALKSFSKEEVGLTDMVLFEKLNSRVEPQLFNQTDLRLWEKVNYANEDGLSEEEGIAFKEKVIYWIKNHRSQ